MFIDQIHSIISHLLLFQGGHKNHFVFNIVNKVRRGALTHLILLDQRTLFVKIVTSNY